MVRRQADKAFYSLRGGWEHGIPEQDYQGVKFCTDIWTEIPSLQEFVSSSCSRREFPFLVPSSFLVDPVRGVGLVFPFLGRKVCKSESKLYLDVVIRQIELLEENGCSHNDIASRNILKNGALIDGGLFQRFGPFLGTQLPRFTTHFSVKHTGAANAINDRYAFLLLLLSSVGFDLRGNYGALEKMWRQPSSPPPTEFVKRCKAMLLQGLLDAIPLELREVKQPSQSAPAHCAYL
jgi:hypothetical protein